MCSCSQKFELGLTFKFSNYCFLKFVLNLPTILKIVPTFPNYSGLFSIIHVSMIAKHKESAI